MGLGHGETDGIAGAFDLVGDNLHAEMFGETVPVDVERGRQLPRRIALDHLAADVNRAVRRAQDVRAADLQIDLDGESVKVLPGEFRR